MTRDQGFEAIGRSGTGVVLRAGATDQPHHQFSVES